MEGAVQRGDRALDKGVCACLLGRRVRELLLVGLAIILAFRLTGQLRGKRRKARGTHG